MKTLRGDHCLCCACGAYFNSTHAFDRHRRGTPGVDRRCLSAQEMQFAGMSVSDSGWWITASQVREKVA